MRTWLDAWGQLNDVGGLVGLAGLVGNSSSGL